MSVSLSELKKAIATLDEAMTFALQSQEPVQFKIARDACIQRFEYCIDLSWKTSMRVLGSSTKAAKPAIREMARGDLISNVEMWLEFIEARNDSSHSYDEATAQKVYTQIQIFLPEVQKLIVKLVAQL
jgi:nucleotidyltransferase substrate binding protein (TIGR01987 family)